MPRGDPFTALCQLTARLSRPVVADLHLHTTASDGDYTPSQVVAFANRARLDAIAITDHDTFAGVNAAVEAASGHDLRVIPGVELTAEWADREVHLLGYFPAALVGAPLVGARSDGHPQGVPLQARLTEMCDRRRERFRDFIRLIRESEPRLEDGFVAAVEATSPSLGRRHIASLLLRTGIASSRREAWQRFVGPLGAKVTPKIRVPLAEAVEWIGTAGGFASLAHPSPDLSEIDLAAMRDAGLQAVETKFPAAGVGRTAELTAWAVRLGLTVTGGSDCHGGEHPGRGVGSYGLNSVEYGQAFDLG